MATVIPRLWLRCLAFPTSGGRTRRFWRYLVEESTHLADALAGHGLLEGLRDNLKADLARKSRLACDKGGQIAKGSTGGGVLQSRQDELLRRVNRAIEVYERHVRFGETEFCSLNSVKY